RRLPQPVFSCRIDERRSGKTHGSPGCREGSDKDYGQVTAVVIILQYHSGSTAPLLATVGGWKIDPVHVAHTHRSSASHCSIIAQASSLALSHRSNSDFSSGVTSTGP